MELIGELLGKLGGICRKISKFCDVRKGFGGFLFWGMSSGILSDFGGKRSLLKKPAGYCEKLGASAKPWQFFRHRVGKIARVKPRALGRDVRGFTRL